jgi:prepilin-type N-terminal cleavage/methylation domain-containing protein
MRHQGFTLSELLIGIVIGAIVILMIFAMGEIASSSYSQLRSKSGVYDDAQYAIDLISGSVRRAAAAPTIPSAHCLKVDANYFYVSGGNSLVYGTVSCTSATNKPIITGVTGLAFDPVLDGQLVHIDFGGTKSGVQFALSADAMRRN